MPAGQRRSRKKKFEAEVERAVRTAVAAVEGNTAIIREARAAKQAEKKRHPHLDTGTAAGKCFLDMRGVFAKNEPPPRAPA